MRELRRTGLGDQAKSMSAHTIVHRTRDEIPPPPASPLSNTFRLHDHVFVHACLVNDAAVLDVSSRPLPETQVTFRSEEAVEVDCVWYIQAGAYSVNFSPFKVLIDYMLYAGKGGA